MVFNRKGKFFLNLDEKAPEQPVSVAPVVARPAPATAAAAAAAPAAAPTAAPSGSAAPKPAASPAAPVAAEAPSGPVLTTAEAIAAELAAAQAARPAITNATFAPECLVPGTALPMRRRRGGANLADFRGMAGSLFGKK
ncbi:MAG: hypothetical protein RLZZ219_1107 [Cyanobacteriota bacterium]|jgi:hypothetical protein